MENYFRDTLVNIINNNKLREPQIEAYMKIKEYFNSNPHGEALVVLPTGTGKSGLVSIAPFGVSNKRVLVITPGLVTKKSIVKTLHPLEDNFWLNYDVILDPEDMPVVEEYESNMLDSSLEKCHFVVANVHKLYENNQNSLLNRVDPDFFDMVIVDEAHHSAAQSWRNALNYFHGAKVLHVTGTPYIASSGRKAFPLAKVPGTTRLLSNTSERDNMCLYAVRVAHILTGVVTPTLQTGWGFEMRRSQACFIAILVWFAHM